MKKFYYYVTGLIALLSVLSILYLIFFKTHF